MHQSRTLCLAVLEMGSRDTTPWTTLSRSSSWPPMTARHSVRDRETCLAIHCLALRPVNHHSSTRRFFACFPWITWQFSSSLTGMPCQDQLRCVTLAIGAADTHANRLERSVKSTER